MRIFLFGWGFLFLILKKWSSTLLSSTAVLKMLEGNSFALCAFRHKLCFVKPDILRMSWRIVSQTELFFVLFCVCRMEKWCFFADSIGKSVKAMMESPLQPSVQIGVNHLLDGNRTFSFNRSAKLNETQQLVWIYAMI